MRITQWGEYAVHCLVFVAESHRAGRSTVNAAEIAGSQGIDQLYAQQILQRLRKRGLIESVRGKQGGYRLKLGEDEITLYDILTAAEGETFTVICETKPLSPNRCATDSPCSLRPIWRDLRDHLNEFLTRHTLRDLVERHRRSEPLVRISGSQAS